MTRDKQSPSILTISSMLFVLLTLLFAPLSFAETKSDSREYHLKAAFLRYVVKYVSWPESVMANSPSANICVYGEVPSLEGLSSITGKVVNDKSIIVRTIDNIDQITSPDKQCHMVFVSKKKEKEKDAIINALKGKPILSFGDMPNFAESGGDMNFYIVNNNLAIMINSESVQSSNLKISPKMLRLVTIFPPAEETTKTPNS